MNKDDYEDTVAAAGVLLRKVLEQAPTKEREPYEALRWRIPSREEAEESRMRAVEEARRPGDHGER